MSERDFEDTAVAGSMSLLSTLSTAVEIVAAMSERRQGRDPSEQQSMEIVVPALKEDVHDLLAQLMALRTSCVAAERESLDGVRLVRHLNDLLLLAGITRRLNGMHQRLMSLFPRVNEDLVEGVRQLLVTSTELAEHDFGTFSTTLHFVAQAAGILEWSRREVKLLST